MKGYLFFCFLLLHRAALCQQPVYQAFDVDTAARPQGGATALDNFIQDNLRKPLSVISQNFSGRVTVTGVAETDGSISGVRVSGELRPDCDREARRVFSLFNAWVPAVKNGQPVRQEVSYPVVIKKEFMNQYRGQAFYYRNGVRTEYLTSDWLPVVDTSSAVVRYKVMMPAREDWILTGDIVRVRRAAAGGWKPESRSTMVRHTLARKTATGKTIYRIGSLDAEGQWDATQFDIDEDSVLLQLRTFKYRGIERTITYAENGMQLESIWNMPTLTGSVFVPSINRARWDTNGQIREKSATFPSGAPDRVYALWDHRGNKIVDKGSGRAVYADSVRSGADTTRQTHYTQTGMYRDNVKQGVWTGRYADGTYWYEEFYQDGICKSGKAKRAGGDTLRYKSVDDRPEFRGGKAGLARFIRINMKNTATGQAVTGLGEFVVRFVIRPDGTTYGHDVPEAISGVDYQAIIQLVKSLDRQWKPAVRRGETVEATFELPVRFPTSS